MILYNVTIILDESIHNEWLNWMRSEHIPNVMNTGYFISNRLLKVLDSPNEGVTYCVQYIADTLEQINEYQQKHADAIQSDFPEQFLNKFVLFATSMEFIDKP
ncbi:DUF4286 family protein [Daejeonella sp. H1SJ63]|jgi:hypothetical protein|uniref:DUF4286 family protein n=1 Tax=Daejeonella sp. H1SJ63 TaxID=3034145 RepID=UPI0023EE2880|nr:DUF4286 family protein [Daejeonella sp. H1SJ63]